MGMEMDRLNSSEEKMNEEAEGKICSTECRMGASDCY